MRYLLDSDVFIDHASGNKGADEFLLENHPDCAVSLVTRAEVLAGFEGPQALAMGGYLDTYATLPVEKADADLAAQLRREHRWKLPDAFQAAFAKRHGLKLVTRNTKDFSPAKHSFVLVPYKV